MSGDVRQKNILKWADLGDVYYISFTTIVSLVYKFRWTFENQNKRSFPQSLHSASMI